MLHQIKNVTPNKYYFGACTTKSIPLYTLYHVSNGRTFQMVELFKWSHFSNGRTFQMVALLSLVSYDRTLYEFSPAIQPLTEFSDVFLGPFSEILTYRFWDIFFLPA